MTYKIEISKINSIIETVEAESEAEAMPKVKPSPSARPTHRRRQNQALPRQLGQALLPHARGL